MVFHVGTSGFGYREWKGKFYPEKIPAGEMLRFYAGRFDAVEINNTFYHMPVESVLETWEGEVPEHFIFSFKAPQIITHFKRLRKTEGEMEILFRNLAVLKEKLGPVLFQLAGSFKPDLPLLKDFLEQVPPGRCAFNFRNPAWFQEAVWELLSEKGCSLCIEDRDEQPVDRIVSTASWGYLRLRRFGYTDEDLSSWLEKILAEPWERAFVFFKHEKEARGPQLAMRFRQLLLGTG